jgi:diguanylate cyclase (GGDEF)-like protein/PAS domain S-box-containing protein
MSDVFSEAFLLKSVINSNADAIIALDAKACVFMWNAGADKLLGWPEDEALSRSVYDFVVPFQQEVLQRRLSSVRPGRPAASIDMIWKHQTGRQIPMLMSISPIQGLRGEEDMVGYSIILRDNSAYKRLLEDFQQNNALLEQKNSELSESIRRERENAEKLNEANDKLTRLASTDGLTGLFNRQYFMKALAGAFAVAARYGRPLAVLFLDLDHFKKVNDTYGHSMGDQVLRGCSRLLHASVRETDHVGRYGGEELVTLMPETNAQQAGVVADRIRIRIEKQEFAEGDKRVHVTVSIGTAAFPAPGVNTPEDLLKRADTALYQAKEAGRNRVVVL